MLAVAILAAISTGASFTWCVTTGVFNAVWLLWAVSILTMAQAIVVLMRRQLAADPHPVPSRLDVLDRPYLADVCECPVAHAESDDADEAAMQDHDAQHRAAALERWRFIHDATATIDALTRPAA